MILRTASTFRRLWVGQAVSVIGDGMQRLAILWWANQQGGASLLTAVALSSVVPLVVASPLGGWLADHRDRRTSMIAADLVRLLCTAGLAYLLAGGAASIVAVCVLVAVASLATAVFDPAYAAAVPTVVDDADLPAANGLNMANGAVGGLLGPVLAGVLIGHLSIATVLSVNAATFAWSAAWIACCRLPRPPAMTGETAGVGFRASMTAVGRVPGVRRLIGMATVLNMVVAPVPMLLVVLAADQLGVGSGTYGVLQVMLSAGMLVGSLAAAFLARGPLTVPFVVLGVALASVGLLPVVGVGAALLVCGVAVAVANTQVITGFQRTVPAAVQGQAFGVVGALAEGLRPAGLALAGPLLAVAGVTGAFVAIGATVVATALTLGSRNGFVRNPHENVPRSLVVSADLGEAEVVGERAAGDHVGVGRAVHPGA